MKRKTVTTLSELHEGDRYIYKNKSEIFEVMKKDGNHIEVNEIVNEKPIYKYNVKKNGKTAVVFLRHTKPLPGEECFIEDLHPGDVFWKADDLITEYELLGKMTQLNGMYGLKTVFDRGENGSLMAHRFSAVVLVRKAQKDGGQS